MTGIKDLPSRFLITKHTYYPGIDTSQERIGDVLETKRAFSFESAKQQAQSLTKTKIPLIWMESPRASDRESVAFLINEEDSYIYIIAQNILEPV